MFFFSLNKEVAKEGFLLMIGLGFLIKRHSQFQKYKLSIRNFVNSVRSVSFKLKLEIIFIILHKRL